ncbi:synaptic plasticity regulator PANTS [Dermatophagoides farinae]|uniref:Synaptic plasticity regulator PANTS n=1 Tax=Dermatophagoides farinae TaxID=6954 RepID=A0A922I4E4_DERFA|nr:UPF0545 protein C22orf39 homolog [Dermatophagoides farinae]KAH7640424.1 hypothetical protein HUG17_7891 [Dermatophagoides farinae]KAH9521327.1 Nitrogen permease regulator-like 2, variant 2 [Dermatophagoides farinae]
MDHDRKPEDRFECELNGNELEKYGPYSWMVRPCEWYLQEYKDCKSIRARLHQYFISGTIDNCDDWRDDYHNCYQFRNNKNPIYLNRLIESELLRKHNRLLQSKANDVWEYRTEPPNDWNKPITTDE